MKIPCECGALIPDITDFLSYKAHFIPDQVWFELLDVIDEAIERSDPTAEAKEAASMRVRTLIGNLTRCAWQCRDCGKLHIDDHNHNLRVFTPGKPDVPYELFRHRPDPDIET